MLARRVILNKHHPCPLFQLYHLISRIQIVREVAYYLSLISKSWCAKLLHSVLIHRISFGIMGSEGHVLVFALFGKSRFHIRL